MRGELARTVSKIVPGIVDKTNIMLLRKHLENTSYISGSSDLAQQERRRESNVYRGRRRPQR
jgi:hypothetical protein